MDALTWDDSFATGVALVDLQHQNLFGIINELIYCIDKGKARDVVADVLVMLKLYYHYHFRIEEQMLADCGYPELEAHQAQHMEFVAEVENFDMNRQLGFAEVCVRLRDYLVDWTVYHIRDTDREAMAWARSKVGAD